MEKKIRILLPEGHDWNWLYEDSEENPEEQYLVIEIYPEKKGKP